jgi:predicted ATPase/serine/threonine protein kinase
LALPQPRAYHPASVSERAADDTLARLARATPEKPVALGRYRVVGRLGRGGMGTVYEAVDEERGTCVALKTLSVANAASAVALKREFRVVADLVHDNLAPVYELSSDRDLWFFTMERIHGVTLTQWARARSHPDPQIRLPLSRSTSTKLASTTRLSLPHTSEEAFDLPSYDGTLEDPSLPPANPDLTVMPTMPDRDMAAIRRAFAELVGGIGALHDAGLRHSDIKPSNVLVQADGRVVLVDFGLAEPLEDRYSVRMSSGGTPGYMPPEQISGKSVGPEGDWYALGATLYRVLTGCRPFVADSMLELYLKKTKQLPTSPQALLPGLAGDLSDLCMALLHPNIARRPGRDALLQVLVEHGDTQRVIPERTKPTLFVGRDAELCTLEQAYGSARAGQLTVVHTHGPSGMGKSALVSSFLSAVTDVDSALVLRGRCYERESVPYKGFDRIVDELARRLLRMDDAEVDALLPSWSGELARVFPALTSVPAIAARERDVQLAGGAIELRRRGRSALIELLAALQRSGPMVLTVDDLQWADADSADLLVELLENAQNAALMVVILYRPTEAADNPALTSYFELCRTLQTRGRLVDLPLEALQPADANRLARAALGQAATDERVALVANEAHGLPFFIEELAYFITANKQPGLDANVSLDEAILARVEALPPDQRRLVEVVAVANSPLPQSIVYEAAELDAGALMPLLALRSASLISWLGAGADDTVSAYHDRIRESVLASLSEDATLSFHLKLGRALAKREGGAARLFDAVRHLRAAEPLLDEADERRAAAALHADAGEFARDAAAFRLAFDCFEGGIGLLSDDAWERDYDLALRLHAGAVESAYLSANWPALERHTAEVKLRSRSVMDQLVAWEAEIDALAGRQEYLAAVGVGLTVLAMLGVELPGEPGEAEVGAAVQHTLERLTEIGPDGLRALPDLDDPEAAAATRIQVRLSPVAYFGKPLLLPLIACHLVTTSIDRGVSTATPYALSLFGIVLNTVELFPVSHTWGQLAAELLERWPDRRLEAATLHILNNLVCCWMVPLSTVLEPLREVFDIGCRTGDYEYASYAAHGYVHNSIYAGRPLAPLLDEALFLGEQMRSLGQVNALHVHEPVEQLLKALCGKLQDPRSLDDAGFDEAAHLALAKASGSRSGVYLMHHLKGILLFYFGAPRDAHARFAEARNYTDAVPSIWHLPIRHQLGALSACAASEQTDDAAERRALRAHIDESLDALRRLAAHAPCNFAHRVSMVEGEVSRIEGDLPAALTAFERAIAEAQQGSWINDVALANELAARCYSDRDEAKRRLRAARTAYAAWGAKAKAEQLAERMATLGSEPDRPNAR